MNEAVRECLLEIIAGTTAGIQNSGQWASGRSAESMRIEETEYGGRIVARPYFRGLELGRPGGPVPRDFTDIIEQWMRDKGIVPNSGSSERDYRSAAYCIGRRIRMYGTRLYREGGRSDVYTPVIDEAVERLKSKLAIQIAERIRNTIK